MIFVDNHVYVVADCTNDHLIVYDIVSDLFTFYEFSSTIKIRSMVYEPTYSRIIIIGDISGKENFISKVGLDSINTIPDLIPSSK